MLKYLLCFCLLSWCLPLQASEPAQIENVKHIVLIGPPASGKGTQGAFISDTLKIPKISTGDLLRAEAQSTTLLSEQIKDIMAKGDLVPDAIVLSLLRKRLAQEDTKNGFILDGFPRAESQAVELANMGISINCVIILEVDDAVIIDRISGRRIHAASGRSYHLKTKPPKVPGKDDVTGEALTQREDDTKEAIEKRLKSYSMQTKPVIAWYEEQAKTQPIKVVHIDSNKPIDEVQKAVSKALKD